MPARFVTVKDPAEAVARGSAWDAVVLVGPALDAVDLEPLGAAIASARRADAVFGKTLALVPAEAVAGERLLLAPTGRLDRDHDDVRRFGDAAAAGVRRARDAGARRPLVVVTGRPADPLFAHTDAVAALEALGGLWEPLEAREALGSAVCEPVEAVGFAALEGGVRDGLDRFVEAVEGGRRLARDLCGTEPERMAPPRFADECRSAFDGLPVTVEVVADRRAIEAGYPLIAAVARAAFAVERHHPRVVRLEYAGEGPIERTLLLAGKGLTYDTGGADVKTGGVMAGMSRDKGGAAAVAGFVHAVAALRPRGLRVIAELGAVRNSIGADAFVSDEILRSHCGVRVRVGNTDAEGRLVLADLLSHLRERALSEPAPHLLSVATLTGHSARAVGPYSIALDNAPARAAGVAERLAAIGDLWGDPFEVSRLRREDWDFVRPRSRADDVLSCNNAPSTATNRGHQFPMAFLVIASGLEAHGKSGAPPLPYTHVDVGGSATEGSDWQHGRPTARPIVGMLAGLVAGALPA